MPRQTFRFFRCSCWKVDWIFSSLDCYSFASGNEPEKPMSFRSIASAMQAFVFLQNDSAMIPNGAFILAWQRLNGSALPLPSAVCCCCSFHLSAEKGHLINKPSWLACAYLRKSENIVPWNRSHRRSTGRTHKPNHFPCHIHATKRSAPNRTT